MRHLYQQRPSLGMNSAVPFLSQRLRDGSANYEIAMANCIVFKLSDTNSHPIKRAQRLQTDPRQLLDESS